MRQNISFVTLGVADLARSRAFYAALGWRESAGSQAEIAFFGGSFTAIERGYMVSLLDAAAPFVQICCKGPDRVGAPKENR